VTSESPKHAVYVVSLGCPKNRVDTEEMTGRLLLADFALVGNPEGADVFLVNTCAFIREARDEATQVIEEAVTWKRTAPRSRVIAVAGCFPQYDAAEILRRFPDVDVIIGIDDVPRVSDIILGALQGVSSPQPLRIDPPRRLADHTAPRLLTTPPGVAYVKIADGCDHRCTFCTIPSLRGRFRSRRPESVVEECRQLLGMRVKELVFVAQDSTMYGADLAGKTDLADLLERCDGLDGDFWIRVMYTHPAHVTDRLLEVMANARHVVRYLDIPIQHVSDRVLRRMGRRPDGRGTRALLQCIREAIPGVAVRTTLITGFPGETEQDFEELLEFVEEYRFDRLGVFAFSPEPGTPAARITDGLVPSEVAAERRERILQAQQRITLENNRSLIGRRVRILVERRDPPWVAGRTEHDAPEIDNDVVVRASPAIRPGQFLVVRITDAEAYRLQARPAPGQSGYDHKRSRANRRTTRN